MTNPNEAGMDAAAALLTLEPFCRASAADKAMAIAESLRHLRGRALEVEPEVMAGLLRFVETDARDLADYLKRAPGE